MLPKPQTKLPVMLKLPMTLVSPSWLRGPFSTRSMYVMTAISCFSSSPTFRGPILIPLIARGISTLSCS